MLIQFTVGNYLSFKDNATLSMVASNYRDNKEHVFPALKDIKLLKSAAIYGANASGKSNLIKAMQFFRDLISTSSLGSNESRLNVNNFKLAAETENKPSFFEIVFVIDKIIYRYGFEVTITEVTKEWLYYSRAEKEYLLFDRKKKNIKVNGNTFKEGLHLDDKTRVNSLFLSVAAQFNGVISNKIMKWIKNFNVISGMGDFSLYTSKLLESGEMKTGVVELLKTADLFIEDVQTQEEILEGNVLPANVRRRVEILPDGKLRAVKFNTSHKKYEDGKHIGQVELDMDTEESEGTRKFFSLSGPILDTLVNGKILVVDELDNSLHPLLLAHLVKLFNSKANNRNAQCIFVAHDRTLLNQKNLRRDQIWFAEKDKYQATKLFSLEEFNIRNDYNIEKNYLLGKFGGIPILNDIENIEEIFPTKKNTQ
ncbi:ATP-binding protein [bacterium]|nr:ATP-binding protein [bacterium]